MRRQLKKQIQDIFDTILDMHEAVRQSFAEESGESILLLLAQCQETAIQVGNEVENAEGAGENASGFGAIKALEVYCEELYTISIKISENHADIEGKAAVWIGECCERLDACIKEAAEHVKKDIPEKIEVVFLPYKASMWDSLESVWMASEEDAFCDSYVMPVPYFDKNPDGSLGEMHYEGGDFPDYVPVTDWQNYDIAARHPDIIYIHNPYDGTNKVTTVHPDFYAKELKKHTDMLVYIPYFVCVNDEVPEHFCITPGTIHSDKVIVQSEKVRETYIQEFRKFEEEYHCRGRFGDPEQKFIALGSPKYDKVLSTTRENVKIPEDWMKKIRKEDGTWKKILLYNTSVTKLLEEKENMLKKIKAVFALMREREDIVLLWRPHPLSETTYAAARPQLLEEYERIVESYKREDWGIFDDTPELDRAIAVSDAYYGDMSSLVELYRMTGKPVMIQEVESI